jgi:hypothetical protein
MLYQWRGGRGAKRICCPCRKFDTKRRRCSALDDQTGGEVKIVGVACAMGLIYDVAALLTDCCQLSDLEQTSSSVQEIYQVLPVRDSPLFCQSVLLPRGVRFVFLFCFLTPRR